MAHARRAQSSNGHAPRSKVEFAAASIPLAVVRRMRERLAIDGVVLAGTELPLVLRDVPDQGIPFLDTAQIHVRRVVDEMLG